MEILSLSTGRNILKEGSRDRVRMALYAEHLAALHIVVLTRRSHGLSKEIIHEGRLHIYPTNSATRLGMLIDAFRSASRILRLHKGAPVTLSSQDPLELGFVAYLLSLRFKIPFTVQVHGDYHSPQWGSGSLLRFLRHLLMHFVLRRATKIRVVSERIKQSLLLRNVPSGKITALPIRPELDVFIQAKRTRSDDGQLIILTASRLAPEKDISRLIAAFALMKKECPMATLRIVGSGLEEKSLRASVRALGVQDSTTFLPWTEHIEVEMANADVFALASRHEAYGLVLIEALATGTPVVTTDVGCVGEEVMDGVHGLVVYEEGVNSYADTLIRLSQDSSFRKKAAYAGRLLGNRLAAHTEDEYAKEWVAAHSVK